MSTKAQAVIDATHIRRGAVISSLATGTSETFKSVNAAKKASRGFAKGAISVLPSKPGEQHKRFDGACLHGFQERA